MQVGDFLKRINKLNSVKNMRVSEETHRRLKILSEKEVLQ